MAEVTWRHICETRRGRQEPTPPQRPEAPGHAESATRDGVVESVQPLTSAADVRRALALPER